MWSIFRTRKIVSPIQPDDKKIYLRRNHFMLGANAEKTRISKIAETFVQWVGSEIWARDYRWRRRRKIENRSWKVPELQKAVNSMNLEHVFQEWRRENETNEKTILTQLLNIRAIFLISNEFELIRWTAVPPTCSNTHSHTKTVCTSRRSALLLFFFSFCSQTYAN